MSDEHPVSEGIFASGKMEAYGGPWGEQGVELPVRLLAAKTLCRGHNLRLGNDVDLEAVRLAAAIRHARSGGAETIIVDGSLLERWCLKALLGIVANGWHRRGEHIVQMDQAPLELVEIAFGLRSFQEGIGLYVLTYRGDLQCPEERVPYQVLTCREDGTGIVGLLIALPPLAFALTLVPGNPQSLLRQMTLRGQVWHDVQAHYRLPRLRSAAIGADFAFTTVFQWGAAQVPQESR